MQAIVYTEYGPPDVLRVADIDEPVAGDDEMLVRIRAATVNPADWHFMRGEPRIARLQFGLRRPKEAVLGCDRTYSLPDVPETDAGVTEVTMRF